MARALPSGFAIAAAVWVVAFVGRLPGLGLPGPSVFAAILGVMLGGAVAVGAGGVAAATRALAVTGTINVLLVGSVATAEQISPLIWIPGSLLATAAVGLAGGLLRRLAGGPARPLQDTASAQRDLAVVTVCTGLCLVGVGGIVTSVQAGLSVPDWPNSYGYGMFLFPLSKMVGGIYFEHSHRLLGSLVGLETLVLAVWVYRRPPAVASIRGLAGAALVLVSVQGALGGLRVVLVNAFGSEVALVVAVIHACMAQIFLLVLTILAVRLVAGARRFRRPGLTLAILVLTQTLIGATIRHFHSTLAIIGHIVLALLIGWLILRAFRRRPPSANRKLDATKALVLAVSIQIPLGVAVLALTTLVPDVEQTTNGLIAMTTAAHVVLGALIVVLAGWAGLAPAPATTSAPSAPDPVPIY